MPKATVGQGSRPVRHSAERDGVREAYRESAVNRETLSQSEPAFGAGKSIAVRGLN